MKWKSEKNVIVKNVFLIYKTKMEPQRDESWGGGGLPRNDGCDACLRVTYKSAKSKVSIKDSKRYYGYLKSQRVEILKSLEHTSLKFSTWSWLYLPL